MSRLTWGCSWFTIRVVVNVRQSLDLEGEVGFLHPNVAVIWKIFLPRKVAIEVSSLWKKITSIHSVKRKDCHNVKPSIAWLYKSSATWVLEIGEFMLGGRSTLEGNWPMSIVCAETNNGPKHSWTITKTWRRNIDP